MKALKHMALTRKLSTSSLVALALSSMLSIVAYTQPGASASTIDFTSAAPQGFGDRQNSMAWSMIWWKNHLYVGTARSATCVKEATLARYLTYVQYPPQEDDIECTPSPQDLPLQAEIWRWTPATGAWELLFRSPQDVPIPNHPGKFVARDIGFRSMVVFTEPDGTEALYVGGTSSNSFNEGVPPPRLLRSVDGETFTPVPQTPGTFLGDLDANSFRSLAMHKGRLYAIVSQGLLGFGKVIEAISPAAGDNAFRLATDGSSSFFEMASFNGELYIGSSNKTVPFSVVKLQIGGDPPYPTTPVLLDGGNRHPHPSRSVVSMYVFKDRLFVSTDRPSELYRINPDDSWDLIVGSPRDTPVGRKQPLSGMDVGFDWPLNMHMWRMQTYNGQLYIGTVDQSTRWRSSAQHRALLEPSMGFDLFQSSDGEQFTTITRNGFGDKFNYGVRTFAVTPNGLFLGSLNQYYGLNIWRGQPPVAPLSDAPFNFFLPLAAQSHEARASAPPTAATAPALAAPARARAEMHGAQVVVSWKVVPGATLYHVFRSQLVFESGVSVPDDDTPGLLLPGPFQELGITDQPYYVDTTVRNGGQYHYYVVAGNREMRSLPSNTARAPTLAPAVSFDTLLRWLDDWSRQSATTAGVQHSAGPALSHAHAFASVGDWDGAYAELAQLQRALAQKSAPIDPWRVTDLRGLLDILIQRVKLASLGVIDPRDL
jgi:hypothetical protein